MEISGLGQLGEAALPETKGSQDASDAFSQLLAALFMNLNQNTQIAPDIIQSMNMEGSSETQTCKDNDFISMIRTMNPDVLKILENNKGDNSKIEDILKELGITEGKDFDSAIEELLKSGDIAITDETAKSIEEVEKEDSNFKNLLMQVNKQINSLKDDSKKNDINSEKIDDKQNSFKIPKDLGIKAINFETKVEDVKKEMDIPKADIKTEIGFDISKNKNQEQITLPADKQINTANTDTKIFEVVGKEQKETQVPFIAKPQDLVDVTVNRFKSLRLPDFTEMRVKLRPDELGEVTVRVVLEKGQINGSIMAERRDVVSMLQSQMNYLKQELKNNNINFSSITVNQNASSDFNGNNASREFNQQGRNNGRRYLMDIEENINESDSSEGFTIIA